MKLNDAILDSLGNLYRWACGVNDVLVSRGRVVTFEEFVREFIELRARRGMPV